MRRMMNKLLDSESAVGILLIAATLLAMLMANSPFVGLYAIFLEIPVSVQFDELIISKPLLLWVNDGLMALFFFMVGLEIKRELMIGSLRSVRTSVVPAFGALGGMVVPALIFWYFNADDPEAIKGWAIPMATDIAFAVGILSLLGNRVPSTLKIFLLALAIIDDLGAIIVIALFYAGNLSTTSLIAAGVFGALLLLMNLRGSKNIPLYIVLGVFMWIAVLKSGVHATIAGVALGLLIPLRDNESRFTHLEHSLHAPVNFVILPLFAFVNTGIGFGGLSLQDLTDTLTLGIVAGLLIGKQIGIFLFSAVAVRLGLGTLPAGVTYRMLYGVSLLGGIGFTMSLFIGSLAFESGAALNMVDERLGILLGSLLSGTLGFVVLRHAFGPDKST